MSSTRPQNRFPACDRCRMQKLKCPRADREQGQPCRRCSHAHVQCITSNRRHPGRPPAQTRMAGNQASRGEALLSTSGTRHSYDDESLQLVQHENSHLLLDDIQSFGNELDYLLAENHVPAFGIEALVDPCLDRTLFQHRHVDVQGGPVPRASGAQANLNGKQALHSRNLPENDHDHDHDHENNNDKDNDQTNDPQIRLAFLQYKLSMKLAQLRALDWDVRSSLTLRCHCLASSVPAPPTSDPLVEIFELMTELESLLTHESIQQHSRPAEAVKELRDASLTSILPAISCYLHVRSLYNYVFSQVLDQSSRDPSVKDFILNSPPPLYIAGAMIPNPVKNMVGLSFVQLMVAKIQPIESALGIPLQLRVSREAAVEAQDVPGQLLHHEQANDLLKMLKKLDMALNGLEGQSYMSDLVNDQMKQIVALH